MNEAALRLKMCVQTVKSSADGQGNKFQEEIALSAVMGEKGTANAQWAKYTPSAGLTMLISNPHAFGKLLPGQFVFVDLTVTDKEAA